MLYYWGEPHTYQLAGKFALYVCLFVCLRTYSVKIFLFECSYVFRKNLFIIYTPNNKINTFNHFENHVFDRWMKTD